MSIVKHYEYHSGKWRGDTVARCGDTSIIAANDMAIPLHGVAIQVS